MTERKPRGSAAQRHARNSVGDWLTNTHQSILNFLHRHTSETFTRLFLTDRIPDDLPRSPAGWYLDEKPSGPNVYFWRRRNGPWFVYCSRPALPEQGDPWHVQAGKEGAAGGDGIEETHVRGDLSREDAISLSLDLMDEIKLNNELPGDL